MANGDTRLKIRRFFRKNQKLVIIVLVIIIVIAIINRILISIKSNKAPSTTYEPNVPVLDSSSKVPKKVANAFEEFIDNYVGYCNNHNYVEAYNLVSDDCKKGFFGNDYNTFVSYVNQKFNSTKRYAIQSFSNYEDKYIYKVKIFDDFLATGLTGQSYRYQEEMMTISYNDKKELVVSVGNYIESKALQYMASNDYLRAEITESMQKYKYIVYTLKLTNRSNYTIVVQDGLADGMEVGLLMDAEVRSCIDSSKIVLEPGETAQFSITFDKFYDESSKPKGVVLDAVRIMETYTEEPETEEIAQNEIENAVDKFSMTIAF